MNSERNPITICTFNIRGWSEAEHDGENAWPNRSTFTSEVINNLLPDIVAFQEFSGGKNSEFYRRNLRGMQLHLGPKMDGDRYNPIAFRPDKLAIKSTKEIWLSSSGEPVPDWGADETRSANLIHFEYKPNKTLPGTEILFVNTHFDNKHELAKTEGAKKIIRELSESPDLPTIIVGDFNSSNKKSSNDSFYTSGTHDLFIKNGFVDVFQDLHPEQHNEPPHTFHRYVGKEFISEIGNAHFDWILTKGFTPQLYEILNDSKSTPPHYPSDHYPIATRLEPKAIEQVLSQSEPIPVKELSLSGK